LKGSPLSALVFDFGGPVLLTPFELREQGEQRLGLPPGSFNWAGPFDPESDTDWQAFQAGDMNEREYWKLQVDRFAELVGHPASMPEMMAPLYAGPENELVRPGALALLHDAKSAGIPVGMLTNDLTAFHDAEWIQRMSVIRSFDAMVDGKQDRVHKPDPAAYILMCERLGVPIEGTVFIDDQPINLRGAEALGMTAIHLDPRDPETGYQAARAALFLASPH
jgi:putative hydrolase of the HAD superfamily